jgi:flagellar protein FlgJ
MADILTSPAVAPNTVYSNLSGLNELKVKSRAYPQEALHEVAQQFESVFITMMMKAMRDTLPKDGMFASSQMDTYQEMFDQQLALDLSRQNGLGLASVIERQLSAAARYQPAAASETGGLDKGQAASQAGGPANGQTSGDESHG